MTKQIRVLQPSVPRACGSCTLCCKVLGVREIDKLSGEWCRHAVSKRGCAIYADRPETCRTFRCLWLDGLTGDDDRPDRVHGVLSTTASGAHVVLFEDVGYRGSARARLRGFFEELTASGEHVVLAIAGNETVLLGEPSIVDRTFVERDFEGPGSFRITVFDEKEIP